MKVHVRRPYWSFPEVAKRWGWLEAGGDIHLDMRRAIMDGTLSPSMWLTMQLIPLAMTDGMPVEEEDAAPEQVNCWVYPVRSLAVRVANFEHAFPFVADTPEPGEGTRIWALPAPLSLSEVLLRAVVFDEDVQAAEAAYRADPDRELPAKEEKTRDKLLVAFAVEHLGWEPWKEGQDLKLSEMLRASEAYGIKIARNTAKTHIQQAWERVKPAL